MHAAAGFPTKDTWIKAIKNGHYKTWPGLTVDAANKHFPDSVETQKGHMKKQRQNVRSTKQAIKQPTENEELTRTLAKQNIMIKVVNTESTVYSNQTGRFPVQSSKGNTSLMVMYDVDANAIDAKPLRSHHDNQMIPAYQKLWERINHGRVNKPKLHILDNEASEAFKAAIRENCDLQLVPPDTHRRNLAERAIQTFKSHFIAILAGVDASFPMNVWDRLVPQAVVTLNILRQSRKNPSISAYQHVNGVFDYNKMPLAPLGCAVEMHEGTSQRKSWDPQSLTGWYIGTSTEHYRCHKIFCKRTRSERISDTVVFHHKYITQPEITPEDQIIKAVDDLTSALRQRVNKQGKEDMQVLRKMNDILNSKDVQNMGQARNNRKEKTVTFADPPVTCAAEPILADPIPEPRVCGTPQEPRVEQTPKSKAVRLPIVVTNTRKRPSQASSGGPTTQSKYATAIREIGRRTRSTRDLCMTELAQAILDDGPKPVKFKIEFANEIFDEETGKLLKYRKLISHPKYHETWSHSSANEFGRLAQGVGGRIKGTDTIFFIHKHQIPQDRWRDITYAKFVCELKPNKAEVH